jgi:GNAT superfamily N-acetyltransferase
MLVVRAQFADLDTVLLILNDAAAWLQSRGIDQWPHPFPRTRVERHFADGDVYLAFVADQPAGTFALFEADPAVWGDQPPDALYLHGLAVRRAYAGSGLGYDLLRQAEQIAAAQGKQFLRLDCWAGSDALRRFYVSAGFTERGVVEPQFEGERWLCRLWEKRVT